MRACLIGLALLSIPLAAQQTNDSASTSGYHPSTWVMGVGLGQPYGGVGGQLQYRPASALALFAGGGYAFAGGGYNAGLCIRLAPTSAVCPFLTAMYGYNAAIAIKGLPEENKLYYGTSVGLGLEIHTRHNTERFLSIQVLLPQRPSQFEEDLEALERRPDVVIKAKPWDVTLAVGYHFGQ